MARLMGDFGGPISPNFVFPPPRSSFAVEERGPRGGVEGGVLSSSSLFDANLRRRRAVDGGMM